MIPKYKIRWHVTREGYIRSWSKFMSGVSALRRSGQLELELVTSDLKQLSTTGILWLDVFEQENAANARIAIDFLDSADVFDAHSIRNRTHYFKRGFVKESAAQATVENEDCCILPFGLNHSCLNRSAWPMLASMTRRRLSIRRARNEPLRSQISSCLTDLRLAVSQPSPSVFENATPVSDASHALYQTRVWPREPSADDLEQLNIDRVAIVRALRSRLGNRFVGGIRSESFSAERFPDVVVSSNVKRRAYARLNRTALIGVYSRGIHHSLANKLSEYLASGLCIVSDPMQHQLPVPLKPGVNYLPYVTAEECADACEMLINDVDLAQGMRLANLAYYREHVSPEAHVLDVLWRSLAES